MKSKLILFAGLIATALVSFKVVDTVRTPSAPASAMWVAQFSEGVGVSPFGSGGWTALLPAPPGHLNYVTRGVNSPLAPGASLHFTMQTSSVAGNPIYNYQLQPENTCGGAATARPFLERQNDNYRNEFYRWWFSPLAFQLDTNGPFTIEAPLTPSLWTSVYGKRGDQAPTEFAEALKRVGRVGLTFGGGCFYGHGINVTEGAAQFTLLGFTL